MATWRVQIAWLSGMAVIFLYSAAWRPLVRVLRRRTQVWTKDAGRWSAWFCAIASALNLVFLIGFPLAFLGRIEGGLPDFVYGVPVRARLLLLIPLITAFMGIAVSIRIVATRRSWRASAAPLGDSVVATALLSFTALAWYWNLLPMQGR